MGSHFSLTRYIGSMLSGDLGKAEYEKFIMDSQREKFPGRISNVIITPEINKEIVNDIDIIGGTRALTDLTTTAGLSKLISTGEVRIDLAEFLSTPPVFRKVGIQIVEVGKSPGVIPTEDTEVEAVVVAEGSEGSPIEPTYDEGNDYNIVIYKAAIKVSRRFFKYYNDLRQPPLSIVDFLLLQRLENAIYRKLDGMIFYGSGVLPEPVGLKNNVNVQGINGVGFSRDAAVDLENAIELYNANDPKFYLMHPNTKKLLKKRALVSGSDKYLIQNNSLNDYPVISSNRFDEGDIFHGGFTTVLIEQFGPGMEIFINPFKDDNAVTIIAWGYYGFTARNPKAISLATSVN